MNKIREYKYGIVVILLLFATSLSFLDRQVLSVAIVRIREDLQISDIDYGFINMGFLIGYAVMFTLGGILTDRFGSRLGLAFSVGFWSFATLLHSVSNTVFHFSLFRFLLGIGEGGCFPGAVKAVIEWVPGHKRALANGTDDRGRSPNVTIGIFGVGYEIYRNLNDQLCWMLRRVPELP